METHRELHLEGDTASRIVALRGVEKDLPALHRMAKDYLADIAKVLAALRGRLAEKCRLHANATIEEVQTVLGERFALEVPDGDLDCVLQRYQRERGARFGLHPGARALSDP